jgi:hypothetical protein
VDAAAMAAGLVGSDEYLGQYRQETRPCGDDLDREVAAEAARLDEELSPEVLRRLVRAGGKVDPKARR